MSNKIVIKLKDPSGSFYIPSQGVSVNRSQIVEVEKDSVVEHALRHGGVIEASKDEWEAFKKKQEAEKTSSSSAPAAAAKSEEKFEKADAEKLLEDAKAKEVVTVKEEVVHFGKKKLGSEAEAVEELLEDEKLRESVKKALEKAS